MCHSLRERQNKMFSFTQEEKKIFARIINKMEGRVTLDESPAVDLYVADNNLEGLVWLSENIFPSWYVCALLAYKGFISCFESFITIDNIFWRSPSVFSFAIAGGQLKMVKLLINNECPWCRNALGLAKDYGFKEIVAILKQHVSAEK